MDEMNLTIDRLTLTFAGAAGHEHRVRAISARAVAILQELAAQRLLAAGVDVDGRRLESIQPPPLRLDLTLTGDEEIARQLAMTIYRPLLLQLEASP